MGHFKGIDGKKVYIDFEDLYEPSWMIREVQKISSEKSRALKRLDPFSRCGGSKRAYQTPEELRVACDSYFKSQECFVYDRFGQAIRDAETGKKVKTTKPLTLSGLARHLKITTNTLRNYTAVSHAGLIPPEYAEIVLEARQKIEEYAESRAYDKDGANGGKFVLKAGFGWVEPQEESIIRKNKIDTAVSAKLLKIKQDESAAKLKLMELGDNEDNDICITIKRKGED